MNYKLDETNPLFLHNWLEYPDFMCRNQIELTFILSIYSACYVIGGLIFFHAPEKLGRLVTFKLTAVLVISSTLTILLIPYYYAKMIAYGLFGLSMIKFPLAMVSACEFVHSRDKAFVCSVLNYYDALTPAIAGLFFLFVK